MSGADMLKFLDTSIIKGKDDKEGGDKSACPRCTGKVFHAEKVEVKGRVYHKKCAGCFNCQKPLSSRLATVSFCFKESDQHESV